MSDDTDAIQRIAERAHYFRDLIESGCALKESECRQALRDIDFLLTRLGETQRMVKSQLKLIEGLGK